MYSRWIASACLCAMLSASLPLPAFAEESPEAMELPEGTPYKQIMNQTNEKETEFPGQETPELGSEREPVGSKEEAALSRAANEIAQGFNDIAGPDANFDGHYSNEGQVPFKAQGILIVNKEFHLPEAYNPFPDQGNGPTRILLPHVQAAYDEMRLAAQAEGIYFEIISGYRSAAYQEELFRSYASRFGVDQAATFSSRGGQSEHQTGLAMDVAASGDHATLLQPAFGETPAGQWLAAHSWEYGFILRYLKGKEAITGYQYEPWHFRYVGKDLAAEIGAHPTVTLEEKLGLVLTDQETTDPEGPDKLYFGGKLYDQTSYVFRFPEDLSPNPTNTLPTGIGDRLYLTEKEKEKAKSQRIPFILRDEGLLVPFEDGWRLYLRHGYDPGNIEAPDLVAEEVGSDGQALPKE